MKREVPLDLVKCGMCGEAAVIAKGHRRVCDTCRKPEHDLYAAVRTLIQDSSGRRYTIRDVSDVLEVEESKVKHLVDSGFFKLTAQGIRLS